MFLVDADSIVYKAGFATQQNQYITFGDGDAFSTRTEARGYIKHILGEDTSKEEQDAEITHTVIAEPEAHACQVVKTLLKNWCKGAADAMHAQESRVFLTGTENFRHKLYSEYKANRKDTVKPVHYACMREYMQKQGAVVIDGMEADDEVCMQLLQDPSNCIIGIDKDLWNVPGWHYNPDKDLLENVTPQEATHSFLLQLLTGDSSDNIPGLPYCTTRMMDTYGLHHSCLKGCGKGSALKILEYLIQLCGSWVNVYTAIEHCYKEVLQHAQEAGTYKETTKGFHECTAYEVCLKNAQLLWMTREVHSNGDAVLFNPEVLKGIPFYVETQAEAST